VCPSGCVCLSGAGEPFDGCDVDRVAVAVVKETVRGGRIITANEPGSAAPGGDGPVTQVGDTGSSFGVRHPHQSSGTARFDTQVLRVASAAVGTESEGNPNSGGRLPECAPCGHPHKILGGAVRCGARCVAPDRYYPTRGRSGGHADPGSDRAHRIGEATFFAGYRVTGGSSSSESAPHSAGCTSTAVEAAIASPWDCDRGENDTPQYSQIEHTSGFRYR